MASEKARAAVNNRVNNFFMLTSSLRVLSFALQLLHRTLVAKLQKWKSWFLKLVFCGVYKGSLEVFKEKCPALQPIGHIRLGISHAPNRRSSRHAPRRCG